MPMDGFSLPSISLHCFLIFTLSGFQHCFLPDILDTLKFVKERSTNLRVFVNPEKFLGLSSIICDIRGKEYPQP